MENSEKQLLYCRLSEECQKIVVKHQIAIAGLTEQQMVDALFKAIIAGDFQRHVTAGHNAQTVYYHPFYEAERLRSKLRIAEDKLDKIIGVVEGFSDDF